MVTGTVVLSIGLSLISVGVNSFAGGNANKDFGSLENLFVGLVVLIIIVLLKHFTKGLTSTSCILFGIIAGYILCTIMGFILPKTATVVVDGAAVEYTKSWVVNWGRIGESSWIAIPKLLPVKPTFELNAILSIIIMFLVTAVGLSLLHL